MQDADNYKILKLIEQNPEISQRELARQMGISLGKTNYCLKALINVGIIKAKNFQHSNNKTGYLYKLTPAGVEEKLKITKRFLASKIEEFETIQKEIEELRTEVDNRRKK